MPKALIDRCQPDSIVEFRRSARQRYDDGLVAASHERRTAAIYLWGYAAEMTLKAAYFAARGFMGNQIIAMQDLNDAVTFGTANQVLWPRRERLHSIRAWAETLVVCQSRISGTAYDQPEFRIDVASRGQRLERYWNVSLRYHKNIAYLHEVRLVKEATEWLLVNSNFL